MEKLISQMTVRGFNIGIFCVFSLALVALLIRPDVPWHIILIAPLTLRFIFDGGRAKTLDSAFSELRPFYRQDERFDSLFTALIYQQIRAARIRLIKLKHQIPEERDRLIRVEVLLQSYIDSKKWWEFWKHVS